MRFVLVIVAVLGAAYAAPRRLAPLEPATGEVIQDEYIVVFDERATDEQIERHHRTLSTIMAQYNGTQRVMRRYRIGSFRGYSAKFNVKTLDAVRENPGVKFVDYNQVIKAYRQPSCDKTQSGATWGLVRTSREDKIDSGSAMDYTYSDNEQGEDVDAYIIDTGIYLDHEEFEGRAIFIAGGDFIDESSYKDGDDGNGHGTHVAGTVMGNKYGIAKKATAIAVKVLSSFGSGSTAGVISGVEFTADTAKTRGKKSVANMSLGGGLSTALNNAVNAAIDEGVNFALAAGNDYKYDACLRSPAAAEKAVTVAASDKDDFYATFTNDGTCVNIVAPGVDVTSAWIGSKTATNTISGTSMASPHVAGVIATLLSSSDYKDYTPSQIKQLLTDNANDNKLSGSVRTGTPNQLLYNQC